MIYVLDYFQVHLIFQFNLAYELCPVLRPDDMESLVRRFGRRGGLTAQNPRGLNSCLI